MKTNRIPVLAKRNATQTTAKLFQAWSDQMAEQGMLYHYDNEPADCLFAFELKRIELAIETARHSRIDFMYCRYVSAHKVGAI